jgi:cellulose synthase/poly-beta-1,6-N-acetylglucosamine synthase-like glycosyltransferase
MLDYENFVLHFVVEDVSDPAWETLCRLKKELAPSSKAKEVSILVAGKADGCSQKIHNLLHSCRNAPEGIEIFAFADSDACLKPNWLKHLVYPLRKARYGASTGYRWFVPVRNNAASLGLSAINAKIAQLLGNTNFNQLWGGSMAVRAETFREIDIESVWEKAISDDLSLSYAIKKAKMKIIFAPGCMVASYEQATWGSLFEFARRQFVITRVTIPGTWWFSVLAIVYSLMGVWGAGAIAVYAALTGMKLLALYASVPALFIAGQLYRAVMRQKMIAQLLPDDAEKMKTAAIADILGTFLWSWVLFVFIASSALGRTITWRGIRYKLIGPTETTILTEGGK